ncbi:18076_t:CDS:2 [Rhizophagus irregularis]|nr:18076_t:CDS:2 [Rhizophagus irregularis]
MDQGWKSLISTDSLSVFNKEEDNWELPTFRVPSDVPTLEEPVTDPSSWKELKDATLNEDYDNEEDAVLASNGELSVPPSTASRLNYYDILCFTTFKHMKTYGCKPLKDESGIVNCNECSKKVLPRGFIDHSANCEKIKAEALEAQNVDIPTEVSNADLTVNKNTKNSTTETHNSNKKRKKSVEDNTKKDGKVVVPEKEEEVVDSEEEVDAVMEAIMYSNPRPLVTRSTSYVPQRSNYFIYNDINEILPKGVA